MQPGQRDERTDRRERSAERPTDSASDATGGERQDRVPERDEPARGEDFDPTSRGDESGEVM